MLTVFPWMCLQPLIHKVLVHGFETRDQAKSITGSLLSKQGKGSEKGHTITCTYQKPLLIPPAGNSGAVWKASFHQNLGLGSLFERATEKTTDISAYEVLCGAVNSFWQTSTTLGQCPGARSGTALLPSAACWPPIRGRMRSLLETILNSVNPEPDGEYFNFAVSIGCLAWWTSTIKLKKTKNKVCKILLNEKWPLLGSRYSHTLGDHCYQSHFMQQVTQLHMQNDSKYIRNMFSTGVWMWSVHMT